MRRSELLARGVGSRQNRETTLERRDPLRYQSSTFVSSHLLEMSGDDHAVKETTGFGPTRVS